MKRAQVIALAITLATIATVYLRPHKEIANIPAPVHKQFMKFVIEHGKTYNTPKEYMHRLQIFYTNIQEARQMRARNDVTHQVGVTKFFDLTREEFKAKYTGLILSTQPRNGEWIQTNNPTDVDWRTKGIVTGVKDQGACGSCWAFSAIAATESAYAQAGNTLTAFAEQQLVDCSGSEGNMGCNGGWMDWAFKYIESAAIETEADYPYTARDGSCKAEASKGVTKISGFTDVAANNGAALESASAARVVSVAVDANNFFSYTGGVISMSSCGTGLDHGVTLVGYAKGSTNYWIVKNSWGSSWGLEGYVHLEKNIGASGAGTCGIRMKASFPTI